MQLINLLPLLPLLPTVLAAGIVPLDLPDGIYLASRDAHTVDHFERIELRDDGTQERRSYPVPPSRESRVRRQTVQVMTTRDFKRDFPNHDDYNACTRDVNALFKAGTTVKPLKNLVVVRGSAFLAVCNYHSGSEFKGGQWSNPTITDYANGHLDKNIGYWRAGLVQFYSYNGVAVATAFMRDLKGQKHCSELD